MRMSQGPTGCLCSMAVNTSMKILNLIHVMVAQAFYSWALREINPLHPDVPRIMLRRMELADKASRVFR
jgi:hypothetical protein